MNEQLNRYELIDPIEGEYYEKFYFHQNQINSFYEMNGNQYPFIIFSKNKQWNDMYLSKKDMIIESDASRDYHVLTYLNMTWATSTTTVDMAFDEQQIIDHTFGLYEEFCYRKEQIPFKTFHNAYASFHDGIMSLIR
jgi:hypothetical protein